VEPDRRDARGLNEAGEPFGHVVGVDGLAVLRGAHVAEVGMGRAPGEPLGHLRLACRRSSWVRRSCQRATPRVPGPSVLDEVQRTTGAQHPVA
jgi:hypothetical protein